MGGLKSNNEFDSLETFFNTRLKDATTEPSNSTWLQIEEELNKLEKEKRKRRFLWFSLSGLLLIGGLVSLWYFTPNEKENKTPSTVIASNEVKKENISDKTENTTPAQTEKTTEQTNPIESEKPTETGIAEKVNTKTEVSTTTSSSQKIQLGAFKHKANLNAFNKIPYKVIEVNSNDGYIRYFAETPSAENNALDKIHEAGFAGAFIKKDFDETVEKSIVKNEGVIDTNEPLYAASNSVSAKNNTYPETKQNEKPVVVAGNIIASKNTSSVAKNEIPTEPKTNSTTIASKNENSNNSIGPKIPTPTVTKQEETKNPVVSETKIEETKTQSAENNTPIAKSDSTVKTQTTAANVEEIKKDSTPAKTEQKDSIPAPTKIASIDSIKKNPFIPEWSLALLGGPNIFNSTSQSSSIKTLNETQNMTYNGEMKLQYRPFKLFSFSGGVNISSYTTQQDATYFKFYKFQAADYQFHSSFGAMPVPMSAMLQGFYFMAPTDTFFSKYSYTSAVQTLNIPVEANIHFLNTKWVKLYLGIGANTSLPVSQRSHLSLIKENSTLEFSYNNVTVSKFNFLLMAGLGCDIRITKHWYVTLNPSYKYGLTNLSTVNGTTYKPSFFSANGGVKFKF